MESIIRDKVMEHFLATGYFSDKQYGFIKGRSTVLHSDVQNSIFKIVFYFENTKSAFCIFKILFSSILLFSKYFF